MRVCCSLVSVVALITKYNTGSAIDYNTVTTFSGCNASNTNACYLCDASFDRCVFVEKKKRLP